MFADSEGHSESFEESGRPARFRCPSRPFRLAGSSPLPLDWSRWRRLRRSEPRRSCSSASSGELAGGRLTLHGVGPDVTWTATAGRWGVAPIARAHRFMFSPKAPATGTLHVAGHRGGDEPTFKLSRPRLQRPPADGQLPGQAAQQQALAPPRRACGGKGGGASLRGRVAIDRPALDGGQPRQLLHDVCERHQDSAPVGIRHQDAYRQLGQRLVPAQGRLCTSSPTAATPGSRTASGAELWQLRHLQDRRYVGHDLLQHVQDGSGYSNTCTSTNQQFVCTNEFDKPGYAEWNIVPPIEGS